MINNPVPIWMSFKRRSLNDIIDLVVHVQSRGVQLYRFNNRDYTINPVNADGNYLDLKMITVFDYVPTVGALFDKLQMEPDADQLAGMAEQFPGKDWRTITVDDRIQAHERYVSGLRRVK